MQRCVVNEKPFVCDYVPHVITEDAAAWQMTTARWVGGLASDKLRDYPTATMPIFSRVIKAVSGCLFHFVSLVLFKIVILK